MALSLGRSLEMWREKLELEWKHGRSWYMVDPLSEDQLSPPTRCPPGHMVLGPAVLPDI